MLQHHESTALVASFLLRRAAAKLFIGVLINTRDVASIVESTKPPLTKPTSYPFAEKNVEEVWSFSQDNLRGEILRRALGILDKQSLTDKMCLLVTKWEQPPAGKENELLTVRADFRSTLVVLTVKNLGIGGDEHFQTDADDGVIRIGPR